MRILTVCRSAYCQNPICEGLRAVESVLIKRVEFKEDLRAFFLQGQSKLYVIMRCPYQAGFDCTCFFKVTSHASKVITRCCICHRSCALQLGLTKEWLCFVISRRSSSASFAFLTICSALCSNHPFCYAPP